MAEEAGMQEYFMGHRSQAGFIGHGMGVAVNEQPVLAPRSKSVLTVGNVIALEPKFVIPQVGAVGIENTYVVTENGMRCLTHSPEEIIEFV
jgi:Xaa-Pro aminopeptidase